MKHFITPLAELEEMAAGSRSMTELDNAFQKFATAAQFADWSAVFVQLPTPGEPIQFIGRPQEAWATRYLEQDYARIDAVIRQLNYSDEAVWWSDFASNTHLDKRERAMFWEARECGIAEGLSTAVRLARGHVWMCAATSPERKLARGVESAFQYSCALYVRHAYRFKTFELATRKGVLRPKEREILLLVAGGNSLKEAAEILGKSERTVYNQIARAKDRLGVDSVVKLLEFL